MEEKVLQILGGLCGAEPGELSPGLDLFEEGLLDSFATVQLLLELEEAFGVSLALEELSREQIATPAKIVALVREAQG